MRIVFGDDFAAVDLDDLHARIGASRDVSVEQRGQSFLQRIADGRIGRYRGHGALASARAPPLLRGGNRAEVERCDENQKQRDRARTAKEHSA